MQISSLFLPRPLPLPSSQHNFVTNLCFLCQSTLRFQTVSFFKIMYFWLCWVFLLLGLFSSCGEQASLHRSAGASHRGGFSCCGAQALGHLGFSSCDLLAPGHTDSSSCDFLALGHSGFSRCELLALGLQQLQHKGSLAVAQGF